MVDDELEPGELERLGVGELLDAVGLGELVLAAEQHRGRLGRHPGHRVGEQVPVGGVDPGGGVVRAGDGGDAPHVVDVPVGDQDRHRLELVLAHDLRDALGGVLARVDHHALGAGTGRGDVAVGAPRTGREACDQHRLVSCVGGLAVMGPPQPTVPRAGARHGYDEGGLTSAPDDSGTTKKQV